MKGGMDDDGYSWDMFGDIDEEFSEPTKIEVNPPWYNTEGIEGHREQVWSQYLDSYVPNGSVPSVSVFANSPSVHWLWK